MNETRLVVDVDGALTTIARLKACWENTLRDTLKLDERMQLQWGSLSPNCWGGRLS